MCKRFYVEVADLQNLDAESGQQLLQQAGIARGHILVVDTDDDIVVRAIREVTGMGMADIKSHSRERNAVAARTMYVHFCLTRGDSIGRICETIDRPRNRVIYYKTDYDRKMFGDREFKLSTEEVAHRLEADPNWHPAVFVLRPVPTKTGKKRKGKKKKRPRKVLVPKKVSNQLEIQW